MHPKMEEKSFVLYLLVHNSVEETMLFTSSVSGHNVVAHWSIFISMCQHKVIIS